MRTGKRGGAAKNKGPVSSPSEGRRGCRGAGGRAARPRGAPAPVSWRKKAGVYLQPNEKPSDNFSFCLSIRFLFQESF